MTNPRTDGLARYLSLEDDVTIERTDCGEAGPCYVARHPELYGCMSHGTTPEEALANLRGVRALYLETLIENGITPPVPMKHMAKVRDTAPLRRSD